jgi:hypothetical protein
VLRQGSRNETMLVSTYHSDRRDEAKVGPLVSSVAAVLDFANSQVFEAM